MSRQSLKWWWQENGGIALFLVIGSIAVVSLVYSMTIFQNNQDKEGYEAWCKLQGTNLTLREWVALKNAHALPGTTAQ